MEELLIDSNSVERDRVENLRSVLSKECSKLVECSNSTSAGVVSQDTRSGSEMLVLENIEQVSILQKCPQWKVSYNAIRKSGHLFFFSGNDGYAEVEIINSDQSWYIVLDGKKRDNAKILGEWEDIPGVITLVSELQLLMSTVENCRICRGCPYENFKDVVPVNGNEPVFHIKSNDGAAYIEYRHSLFHGKIIRSMSCMVFLPGSDDLVHKRAVCELFFKTEHCLHTKKSRYYQKSQDEKNDESTAKLKPVAKRLQLCLKKNFSK